MSPDFGSAVPEARRQQAAWTNYIDFSKVKAFVNIAISPAIEWGARNLVLGAGLGGMRPNIAVLGFYNMDDLCHSKSLIDAPETSRRSSVADNTTASLKSKLHQRALGHDVQPGSLLPTDSIKTESMVSVSSYVTILEDLLLQLQINVAIAKGFQDLEFPQPKGANTKKYIDLWPIQMSAEIDSGDATKADVLTTNFDTYTLILQLGCILNTVPAWKKAYKLRVAVFVEYESDVEEERGRVRALLLNLRIEAEILVFWLASGALPTYEVIVNGSIPSQVAEEEVNDCLKNQDWWEEIQAIRGKREQERIVTRDLQEVITAGSAWPEASFQQGPRHERVQRFLGLRKLLRKSKRRHTITDLHQLGLRLNMHTHSYQGIGSGSEDSDADGDGAGSDDDSTESAVSEGDIEDYASDHDLGTKSLTRITRRRSHGDSMRGPPPSKRSTGEKEPVIPTLKSSTERHAALAMSGARPTTPKKGERAQSSGVNSPLLDSNKDTPVTADPLHLDASPETLADITPKQLEDRFSALRSMSSPSRQLPKPSDRLMVDERPSLSRHASQPKFSSRPVPVTRVATEDGPGPSIMFADTPSPPVRKERLPSAYRLHDTPTLAGDLPDHISETSETSQPAAKAPREHLSRRGSTYSTQSVPLSFNDLPCRAQHLILNELIRSQSADTAVVFTTLPAPMQGTSRSEESSIAYLSDLEVLCRGCPPCLLVHSNSMTVTMSL